MGFEITLRTGEQLQALIQAAKDTPPEIIEGCPVSSRCRRAIERLQTCKPCSAAKALSFSRIDTLPAGLSSSGFEQSRRLARVELEQHRLHRADRCRRERERAVADRDERERADRLRGHLAAKRHRLAVRVGLAWRCRAAPAASVPTATSKRSATRLLPRSAA